MVHSIIISACGVLAQSPGNSGCILLNRSVMLRHGYGVRRRGQQDACGAARSSGSDQAFPNGSQTGRRRIVDPFGGLYFAEFRLHYRQVDWRGQAESGVEAGENAWGHLSHWYCFFCCSQLFSGWSRRLTALEIWRVFRTGGMRSVVSVVACRRGHGLSDLCHFSSREVLNAEFA